MSMTSIIRYTGKADTVHESWNTLPLYFSCLGLKWKSQCDLTQALGSMRFCHKNDWNMLCLSMEILLGLVWGAALFYFMTLLHSLQIFSLVMPYCMCICILYVYRAKVMPCFFLNLISSVCLLRYGVRGDTRSYMFFCCCFGLVLSRGEQSLNAFFLSRWDRRVKVKCQNSGRFCTVWMWPTRVLLYSLYIKAFSFSLHVFVSHTHTDMLKYQLRM